MNPLHLHLALNHFPLPCVVLGAALLQWSAWSGRREHARAALALFLVGSLATLLSLLTGHASEHLAETLLAPAAGLIERHEDPATAAAVSVGLLAALSGWQLWKLRRADDPPPRWTSATMVAALASAALLAFASYRGGQIRHSELQPDWKELRSAAK